jgi:putative ABC transport system permease protein
VVPVGPGGWQNGFYVEGQPSEENAAETYAEVSAVSADYFATMGIPRLRGREFTRRDGPESPRVAIVDEVLAQRYWPDEDPMGKRIKWGDRDADNPWMEVVGVVGHVKVNGVIQDSLPQIYIPHAQDNDRGYYLMVKAAGDPAGLIEPIRSAVFDIDPDQPISSVNTMEQYLRDSTENGRFQALLLGIFAAAALLLASVGLYGVMAQVTAERTHEIGVRVALGATGRAVVGLVVRQGMLRVTAGIVVGLLFAAVIGRMMASGLFGVSAYDPTTFLLAPLFLGGVALVASLIPARRALRVDPVRVLQSE